MKKTLHVVFIFLFCQAIHAASYDPGAALSAMQKFSFAKGDVVRSQLEIKADIDILALKVGQSTIGLPMSVSYTTKSLTYRNLQLNGYASFALGVSYRYRFNDIFSLKGTAYASLRYFNSIKAATGVAGFSLLSMFSPSPSSAITIPIEVEMNAKQTDIAIGLALSFFFNGGGK